MARASMRAGSAFATRMSARSPSLRVAPITRRPARTSRRFSPRSGTQSATVASATSSRSSVRSVSSARSARASMWATPAPQSSGHGYPATPGCTSGASGSRPSARGA